MEKNKIEPFKKDWKEIRGRTYEFLDNIPNNKITWKPHKDLGTIGQQIRHIGVSQRSYINGIKIGKIDFNDKIFNPEIEKDKEKAINFLKDLDNKLFNILDNVNIDKKIIFVDGIAGESVINLKTVLNYLIEHEVYHQGIFTCYGRLLGLGKFRFM